MIDQSHILQTVAGAYGITVADIRGQCRKKHISQARRMVCLVMKDEPPGVTAGMIGRSPEVVRRNLRIVQYELEIYPDLQRRYQYIMDLTQFDMSIKMNIDQLQSLHEVIGYYLRLPAGNMADELINLHLDDISERIRKRVRSRKPNLPLDEKQAKAFTLWYLRHHEGLRKAHPYGGINMIDVINQIKPVINHQS